MSSCIVTQDCFSCVTIWHDMVLLYCHTKRLDNNVMALQTIHPTEHIKIAKHDTIILLCLVSDNTFYDKQISHSYLPKKQAHAIYETFKTKE